MSEKTFAWTKIADPAYFAEGRLAAHSDHAYFKDDAELAGGVSSWRRSLSGLWHFHCARNIDEVPAGFEKLATDCHAWPTIRVPAHIQMEGYGRPQYTNIAYPWDGREDVQPGEVPQRFDPVACYVRYFEVPTDWQNTAVTFGGADSSLAVWCNGYFVGYSEDTFTPAAFDLTPYIQPGENKLAAAVTRFSSGSWLEDQDCWRFSGLFREVELYTQPAIHLQDLFVQAVPVQQYRAGRLSLACKWNTDAERRLELTLYDGEGQCCLQQSAADSGRESRLEFSLPEAELWSAEHPYLYRAHLAVYDKAGSLMEVVVQDIGFREFKLEDGLMKINGKRIVFRGVNRHEFDCDRGRAIDPAAIEQDIIRLKRYNINALRCSHYPNQSRIYELCDRYGIYVIDETNLETHGTWQKNSSEVHDAQVLPDGHPEWQGAVLDRASSMFSRDKNHACILIWSCGNESFGGETIARMSQFFHEQDPTRLVHYEGLFHDRRFPSTSDMESQMYTKAADIKAFLQEHKDKPFICCEYTHAMGNSNGGISRYTRLTDAEPRYQGGFIWDFVDQALRTRGRDGKEVLRYGGDFGDRPTDYNFCGDGIFLADRRPTSKLQEVKYCYQGVQLDVEMPMRDEPAAEIKISNKCLFTDVSAYGLRLELLRDGTKVWQRKLAAPAVAPGEEKPWRVSLPYYGKGEYVLTASLHLKEDCLWAQAGYEIAFGQGSCYREQGSEAAAVSAWLAGSRPYLPAAALAGQGPLRIVYSDVNIGVQGDGFAAMFSSGQGALVSYRYNEAELLEEMPRLSFWRAPVDNDFGSRYMDECAQWKLASLYAHCVKTEVQRGTGEFVSAPYFGALQRGEAAAASFTVRFTYALPMQPAAECRVTYTVLPDGRIETALDYDKVAGLPDMPDFAMIFTLSADYSQVRYYGRGPADNYCDRQEGARLGVFQTTAAEAMEPYLCPQECGSHGDVRWIEVADHRGRGLKLMLENGQSFEASALPYSPQELEQARHGYDLPSVQHTFLRASAGQCGVGGDDTWGAPVLAEYKKRNQTRHFAFAFCGI